MKKENTSSSQDKKTSTQNSFLIEILKSTLIAASMRNGLPNTPQTKMRLNTPIEVIDTVNYVLSDMVDTIFFITSIIV